MDRKENRAVCIRLFNLLFAIGHASCVELFYFGGAAASSFEQAQECALYKRIIIFIERWFHSISKHTLGSITLAVATIHKDVLIGILHTLLKVPYLQKGQSF